MSKTITFEPTGDEAVKIEAVLDDLIAEMERAREQMANDQKEINKLKAHTRAILARLKAA